MANSQRPPALDVGKIQDEPLATVPVEADARTKSELSDWENIASISAALADEADVRAIIDHNIQRAALAKNSFWLVIWWLIAVVLIIVADGVLSPWKWFFVSDSILIALISGTTINVIGVLIIVMRFFFPPHSPFPVRIRGAETASTPWRSRRQSTQEN